MLKRWFLFVFFILLSSCSSEEKQDVLPQKSFSLKKSSFSDLSGWKNENVLGFDIVLKDVCCVIDKNQQQSIKSDKIAYPSDLYKRHCRKMMQITNLKELKLYIENNFEPYLVMSNGTSEGKFTSYYEAVLQASYVRDDEYKYPIYGKPNDLVEINLKDFDDSLPSQRLVGRVKNGKLIKYYTREEIDKGYLDAPVILWGNDPVDIYIMQIQGAAVATLPNGEEVRVAYSDNNGHKFKGIGSILLSKGLIKSGESSMQQIREWLKNNGEIAHNNMLLNERFIFHKIVKANGPLGAMGLPLIAGRSIAVDKSFIPLGSIMWLETTAPDGDDIHKLVMAEDVGSAIKGAIRGDYFWGHGEDALEFAGKMNSRGRYFILLPKGTKVEFYD